MPLLKIKNTSKVRATIDLNSDTAAKLDHYAAFTGAHADLVIEGALDYLFAHDKEFLTYFSKNSGKNARESLRVKKKSDVLGSPANA